MYYFYFKYTAIFIYIYINNVLTYNSPQIFITFAVLKIYCCS